MVVDVPGFSVGVRHHPQHSVGDDVRGARGAERHLRVHAGAE